MKKPPDSQGTRRAFLWGFVLVQTANYSVTTTLSAFMRAGRDIVITPLE